MYLDSHVQIEIAKRQLLDRQNRSFESFFCLHTKFSICFPCQRNLPTKDSTSQLCCALRELKFVEYIRVEEMIAVYSFYLLFWEVLQSTQPRIPLWLAGVFWRAAQI